MVTTVKRFPSFQVDLITESTSYELTYDTKKQLKQADFEQALISFSVKNSMADDSPVFSLVILAKEKWDKLVNSNDLIRIRVYPDTTKPSPDNPYIMVGLISDIHKEGEYSDGTLLYRITGRAMTKALISFEVGVIQEVATVIPSIGWLPDGTQNGLKFSGNTAAGIGNELMERFVYKYTQYAFAGGKGIKDYLTHSFTSWEEDESLADSTPFVNYQGSLRQFLEDVAAKPFNELFFEYTKEGTCVAIMRPTPFDPENWQKLPAYRFTSDIVVEESFGKSDAEMYSVFVVQAPNLTEFNSMDLGVFPKFHPELVKKYGYKRLDAENRYLLSSEVIAQPDTTASSEALATQPPVFADVLRLISEKGYNDAEVLRTQRNTVKTDLLTQFPGMTDSVVDGIIDGLQDGTLTQETYNEMLLASGDPVADAELNKERSVASAKLEKYTQKTFNWYCENANFYSGDIRVIGNPAYRLGSRIMYEDFEQETTWEFYIEAVQHEFSFTSGYTTIIGVTRGLPNGGSKRFTNLWGKSEDFKGGYLGEPSLDSLLESAKSAQSTDTSIVGTGVWGTGGGSGIAVQAMNLGRELAKKPSIYVFGGGRTQSSPFNQSPIKVDCSSFVWWCYNSFGVQLKGGKTGMTTDTIKVDPRMTKISAWGSSKEAAKSKLQAGDLVYFDTYKKDGHVAMYIGDGRFIGSQGSTGIAEAQMNSGYWWDKFKGHVLRYSAGNPNEGIRA